MFLGLVDYSWILFILLPIVLGISIGAMPNKKYLIWGSVITAAIILIVMVTVDLAITKAVIPDIDMKDMTITDKKVVASGIELLMKYLLGLETMMPNADDEWTDNRASLKDVVQKATADQTSGLRMILTTG